MGAERVGFERRGERLVREQVRDSEGRRRIKARGKSQELGVESPAWVRLTGLASAPPASTW